jgi:hypothetical protein
MRSNFFKKATVTLCALVFCLVSTFAFAAEKQWYVLKDKNGTCTVRQLKEKTKTAIGGPYATKDAAQKAKAEKCPKTQKKSEPGK